jgi:hypothetical protein
MPFKRPLFLGKPAPGQDKHAFAQDALEKIAEWSHEQEEFEVTANIDMAGFFLLFPDSTGIKDENGNEQLIFQTTATAVNYWEMTNSAANGVQRLAAQGDDANIAVTIASKGTDPINLEVNGNIEASLDAANFKPGANDGNALGVSGTAWADLFLASGGVINWNAGNATLTHSAGLLTSNVDIAVPDEAYDATNWNGSLEVPTKNAIRDKLESLPEAGYPPGHIFGLTLSNAADANNDITIAAGSARDEDDTENMALAASITKQLDAAWAVGTNAGGLNTGAEAISTWYEVILIKRTDTDVVDVMFSTTANRTTLPTSYDKKRRIGWIRNDDSSNILAFTQVDDHFTLTTQINDASVAMTTTAAQITLTVPPNTIARFRATGQGDTAGTATNEYIVLSEVVEGNVTPSLTTGIASLGAFEIAAGVATGSAGHFELRVNGSSQIEHDSTAAEGTFDISTYGWIDLRRRLSAT